jgi:integrase
MLSRHIRKLRDELNDTPGAANQRLKALKALFAWGCEDEPELAPQNPTLGVKKLRYATRGHHSWTGDEIKQYRDRHPVGSMARLALDLLLYTGGRREDAVRLGPQHVRDGRIRFTQAKNEHRTPIHVDIPVHPELAAAIAATPSGHLTFLITKYGKPFTPPGFGNAMRDWCNQANLHHCSAHGLRKACATALAEAGATVHEIASVTGHQSLEEIERYTRAAERKQLADRAMKKFKA